MKRRILLFASSDGTYGGVEAFVLTLARHLQQSEAFEPAIMLKVRSGQALEPALLGLFAEQRIPVQIFRSNYLALASAILRADLIHGNYPAGYLGPLCRLRHKPWVLTVHNWKRTKRWPMAALETLTHFGARRRWYNSRFVADTWEPGGLQPDSAVVPTVSDLPNLWIEPTERRGFVFAARWIPNKGLEELIEAYATADLDRTQHPLVLLGDGPLWDHAHDLLQRFGGAGVSTPGFVTEAVKRERIAHARWLVAPAKTLEDLGLTPIEARSCGVPAIVTRDGGLPEAAGAAGTVVPPGNVPRLRAALQAAAALPLAEYAERARLARSSLQDYLRPLSFYEAQYQEVLRQTDAR